MYNDFNLNWILIFGVLLGIFIVLGGLIIFGVENPTEIKSENPIKPRIELIIKDNKVDTLYIYSNE